METIRHRRLAWLAVMLFMAMPIWAQSKPEMAKPLIGEEIVRQVAIIDIDGKRYEHVLVSLQSKAPNFVLSNKVRVKVMVYDQDGNRIYKNTYHGMALYVYTDGQIQVSGNNMTAVVITPSKLSDDLIGVIREHTGVI